jgi:peptide/nickel transport system ATP-binding protein
MRSATGCVKRSTRCCAREAALSDAVLRIEGLHVAAAARRGTPGPLLLRGVDLRIAPGEVHALVGESGAGKSMVCRTVLGIVPHGVRVLSGAVHLFGHDWLSLPEPRRRAHLGRDVSLIPQDPQTALNPSYTIGRQVGDVLRLHLGLDASQARERAAALLSTVQLRNPKQVLAQYPHELSGGMRQRVLIAMAFACKPRLIVADEPTTALDVTVQREILRLLRALQRDEGAAVLFITHNLGLVAKLGDRVSVIHAGRIVEHGDVRSTFEAPRSDYTRALMAATPRHDRPAAALQPVAPAVTDALLAQAHAYDAQWHKAKWREAHGG